MLRDFRQEIQRAENLKVSSRPATQIAAGRTGKAAAMVPFGSVDHRAIVGQTDHAGQAERTAHDALRQQLQARCIVRRLTLLLTLKPSEARSASGRLFPPTLQLEGLVLPRRQQPLRVALRQAEEGAVGRGTLS